MAELRTFLVPVDFSDPSGRALAFAVDLGVRLGARVVALAVYDPRRAGDHAAELAAATTRALDAFCAAHGDRVEKQTREGDPRDVILEVSAELPADLVVMGTHGRRGAARAVFGSVAEAVVREAPAPVVTLR